MNPNSEKPAGAREWTLGRSPMGQLIAFPIGYKFGGCEPPSETYDVIEKSYADKREAELVDVIRELKAAINHLQSYRDYHDRHANKEADDAMATADAKLKELGVEI